MGSTSSKFGAVSKSGADSVQKLANFGLSLTLTLLIDVPSVSTGGESTFDSC